jgi:hypothetical protein
MVIVVLLWLITFWQFVPLHNAISKNIQTSETLVKLVRKNWIRTGLWTILFVLSNLEFIYEID